MDNNDREFILAVIVAFTMGFVIFYSYTPIPV